MAAHPPTHTSAGNAASDIADRIVGHIVDYPKTMKRLFAKLIRSYAVDGLDSQPEVSDAAKTEDLDALMANIAHTQTFSDKALGLRKTSGLVPKE